MRRFSLLGLLAFFIALVAAFSEFDDIAQDAEPYLRVRQDANSNDGSSSITDTSSPTSDGSSPSVTASPGSSSGDGSASSTSGQTTGSNSGSGTRTTGKPSKSSSTQYDPRLPAGGVSMVTPNPFSGAQYYKIGDWVTFAWNYTSLSATPSRIDILATCTANQNTYTLAVNQTVRPTQEVLWDTGAYQDSASVPLLTEHYTLIVYDAASSPNAVPAAGYLAPFDTFSFGMYVPQQYTPLSSFRCATCSAAVPSIERHTITFLGGMGLVTVLTFTWFANSFGLF